MGDKLIVLDGLEAAAQAPHIFGDPSDVTPARSTGLV